MPVHNGTYPVVFEAKSGKRVAPSIIMAANGPKIVCEIRIDLDRAKLLVESGQALPKSISGSALIDTGATRTAVCSHVITMLGIPPITRVPIMTAGGLRMHSVHRCGIAFPGSKLPSVGRIDVTGAELRTQPTPPVKGTSVAKDAPQVASASDIICLIGRDLLRSCVFTYNGLTGTFSLSI